MPTGFIPLPPILFAISTLTLIKITSKLATHLEFSYQRREPTLKTKIKNKSRIKLNLLYFTKSFSLDLQSQLWHFNFGFSGWCVKIYGSSALSHLLLIRPLTHSHDLNNLTYLQSSFYINLINCCIYFIYLFIILTI